MCISDLQTVRANYANISYFIQNFFNFGYFLQSVNIITQTSFYICLSTILQALTARVSYKTKVMHVVKIAIVNLGEKLNSLRFEKY